MKKRPISYFYFSKVESTMDMAKKKIKQNPELLSSGCVIVSDYQTKGRGTKGRSWVSDNLGGLYYTLIFQPKLFNLTNIDQMQTLVASELKSIIDSIAQLSCEIKKPNDILINKKKVAGILVEASSLANSRLFNYVCIGIGLNLNQKSFGSNLCKSATSLQLEAGKTFEKNDFVQLITTKLLSIF
jgi:BirA family transcriptional regulator, biotin operon repressor / biotin---[acetyl-CoA-carboxylase] ligase